jgi:hypothetical protein
MTSCEDQESKRQLGALRQLTADTPLYPGFKQVHSYDNNKIGDAILVLFYNSPASYEDLKRFYSKTLLANGWVVSPEEERRSGILHSDSSVELVFRKGEYQIAIQYERDATPSTRDFAITYVWERR